MTDQEYVMHEFPFSMASANEAMLSIHLLDRH